MGYTPWGGKELDMTERLNNNMIQVWQDLLCAVLRNVPVDRLTAPCPSAHLNLARHH